MTRQDIEANSQAAIAKLAEVRWCLWWLNNRCYGMKQVRGPAWQDYKLIAKARRHHDKTRH